MGKFVNSLDQKIQAKNKKRYRREQYQSFMRAPEWRSVEIAQEYAQHLREGNSLFHYPYFRQLFDLWKIIFQTYFVSRKYNSIKEIAFSEFWAMDVLIGIFTTMEFIPKAIISLFIAPFISKKNKTSMQEHIATEFYQKYADGLQTIPFYDHNYAEMLEVLTQKYKEEKRTWADWFTWKIVSWDLWGRKWLSKPFHYWFQLEENLEPTTTDVIVRYDAIDITDAEQAKQMFTERLAEVSSKLNKDSKIHMEIVDQDLYAKNTPKSKNNLIYTSVYARLSVPRYATFQKVVYELGKEDIHLRKIAGQDRVQVKCIINTADEDTLQDKVEALKQTKDATFSFSYKDRLHSNREILLFDVPVKNLDATIERFKEKPDATVNFIHNF